MWRKRIARLPISSRQLRFYSAPSETRYAAAALASVASSPKPVAQSVQSSIKTWSSPHDGIARDVFAGDYVHAWTLLEACLESGNLDRAEPVLVGFAEMATDENDVALALNNYLLRLVHINAGKPLVAEVWLNRMKYLLKHKFEPNSITDAIMLKNAFLTPERAVLDSFLRQHSGKIPQILSHVEILGVKTVKSIIDYAKLDDTSIDSRTLSLLSSLEDETNAEAFAKQDMTEDNIHLAEGQTSSDMTEPSSDAGFMTEPIEKPGFDTIVPTGSVGLKSIRHVLAGLKIDNESDKELKFLPLVQEKSTDNENYIDFFEMSKGLDEAEYAEFEKTLDQINERRQQAIETRGVEAARMKWQGIFDRMVAQDHAVDTKVRVKGLESLLWEWHQQMIPLIKEEYEKIDEISSFSSRARIPEEIKLRQGSSVSDRFEYGPYLKLARLDNLPAMTMMELLRLNNIKGITDGIRSTKAVLEVGKNIELDYRLRAFKRKEREALKGVVNTGKQKSRRAISSIRSRVREMSLENKQNSWPTAVRAKIGALLISLFLRIAKVNVDGIDPVTGNAVQGKAPAFYHTYQYKGGNKIGVLRAHKKVAQYLTGESTAAVIQPQQLPMLVSPRPWTAYNEGGYYYSTSKVIRTRNSMEQLAYVKEASKRGQLDQVYEGLNVLGKTAWTINKDMFRIISHIWNSEKEFLDIPPNVNPHPDPSELPAEPPRDADPQARRDYLRECRAISLSKAALYSQRCDLNYKLDIARAYLGERFYLPHNLDFRGRAYPLSPHLSHLGNDVSRSLLLFWRGKKLGPDGLRWLKIHAANLYGMSKASHEDRLKYIDDNIESVKESARNPLDGTMWWKKADDPFQMLATCIEINKALESGNPEEFVSHLTVHQDGSCNGLQHYAALGGDFEGAYEVNLTAAEKPQDVYSRVLDIVRGKVFEDAENGNAAAKALHPVLSRKIVKQTVMTHVYGVTFIGAREQIANRLREVDSIPKDNVYSYSSYLADKVLKAVRQLFESAHLIQDWLGENASRITHSVVLEEDVEYSDKKKPEFLSSVIWTTPLGLPIVQPYRHAKKKQIFTEIQTVYIEDPYSFQSVNARKQRMAFPPNYIHSLDATHMLMSAIACSKDNIDFAAVHDSYWTHASDVDVMGRNLRECFVKLHSNESIENLKTEFQKRYAGLVQYMDIPANSEVGRRIKEARQAFAQKKYGTPDRALSVLDQLEMERTRLKQIRAGEETPISTSVSIVAELTDEEFDTLLGEGIKTRRAKQATSVAKSWKRSSEHKSSAADVGEVDEEKIEEEASELGAAPSRKDLISALVPLRIPSVPHKGGFDVTNVLGSPYFFS